MTAKQTRMARWAVLLGALVWLQLSLLCGASLAEGPLGRMGAELQSRLMGLANGFWVGQTDPQPYVVPGETIGYFIYYGNNGPLAQDCKLVILLPQGCSAEEIVAPAAYTYDAPMGRIEIALGALTAQASGSVRVVARVGQDGMEPGMNLVNRVEAWKGATRSDAGASAATVLRMPRIEMDLTKPGELLRCGRTTYWLSLNNTGNLGATHITLTLTLPPDFEVLAVYADPQPAQAGQTLTWVDLPGMQMGASRTISVLAHIPQTLATDIGKAVTCTASVSSYLNAYASPGGADAVRDTVRLGTCPSYMRVIFNNYNAENAVQDVWERWGNDTPEEAADDAWSVATLDTPQLHSFNKADDEDWVRFYAEPGTCYRVETYDLLGVEPPEGLVVAGNWVPRTDTLLAVYEPKIDPPYDRITGTLLCESDDVDTAALELGSVCCITATTRGWYWVQVKPYNPYRDDWKYDLRWDQFGWRPFYSGTGYTLKISEVAGCPDAPAVVAQAPRRSDQ